MEPESGLHQSDAQPASPQPARSSKAADGLWIGVTLAALLVLLAVWLRLTPAGFTGKLQAIGYAVCHQISGHSFTAGSWQFPLCARCTGMYLGALLSTIFLAVQGRKGKFPSTAISLMLGLFFLAFTLDGLNSFLETFPITHGVYEPSNTLRLLTGLGTGLGIGAVLIPMLNQTLWQDWRDEPVLKSWWRFALMLSLAVGMAAGILGGLSGVLYGAAIVSTLGVVWVLSLLYTVLAVMALRRSNQATRARELFLPGLIGLLLALAQIALTGLLRYLVTGTWGAINL